MQPLGKKTKNCSPDQQTERRRTRLKLQRYLWTHSKLPRIAKCGRRIIHSAQGIAVRLADKVAHFTNVQHCGSVWSCPTCAPRIRQERALELDTGLTRWLETYGPGTVMLLTITLPHEWGESLAGLMATVKQSWRAMLSGEAWMMDKSRFALGGWVRSWDMTHGASGFHPHKHVVLFSERALTDTEIESLKASLYYRYNKAILARSGRVVNYDRGFDLDVARSRERLAEYVTKVVFGADDRPRSVAMECARGDLKTAAPGRRTPFQILADAEAGSRQSLAIWQEYEVATRGCQFMRWSNGLKTLLGVNSKTDEEIVAEEIGGETIYTCTPEDWQAIVATRGARTRVLELAEGNEGPLKVAAFVRRCRIRWIEERRSLHLQRYGALYG